MDIETLKTESYISGESQPLNNILHSLEIPALIEKMKRSISWENGELNSIVLHRSPGKRVVLTALHKETEIVSLPSVDPVSIQVIEGKLNFQNQIESVTLSWNQSLTITDRRKFRLKSLEETVFLLTILKGSC